MKEPSWLSPVVVLAIDDAQIREHGGRAGVRDEGLLGSALTRAQNHFSYGNSDLFDLAAVYAHGIVRNHPFIDGNKRVAFLACYTFLGINGASFTASEADVVTMMLQLADGSIEEAVFSAWLRKCCDETPSR